MRCASYGFIDPRVATAATIGPDDCDAHPAAEATHSSSAPETCTSYNQIRSTARHPRCSSWSDLSMRVTIERSSP